jgi:hypothetical protein
MKIPTSYEAAIAALLVLMAIICPQLAHAGICKTSVFWPRTSITGQFLSQVHTPCGEWTVITYPGSSYIDGFDPWGWYHHGHIKRNGQWCWEY